MDLYNKSLEQTTIDIGSAYLFGKVGGYTWGKLNPLLNNNGERYIMFISTQTWNYTAVYGASKKYGTD